MKPISGVLQSSFSGTLKILCLHCLKIILLLDKDLFFFSQSFGTKKVCSCFHCKFLEVQSCKLYNNKYVTVSTHITNTEIFALTVVLVFKLLSRKFLFINRKDNRNY